MDNQIAESGKTMNEVKTKQEKELVDTETVAASASVELNNPPPILGIEVKKIARDAKSKRKDDKTVQQVLKSLDNLKSPEEKLSAMCKKYSELLHENRQLQGTIKQSEKDIIAIHREKEQFRHERSKAVLARTRMEQLCRELQKLNKAQLEETALKFRVEEEKRKEICFNFQSALAEMNTLTNQNNEKSAKMRDENLEMREKLKSVRERIELTETQLDKVRQQAKLELELAREKLARVTLELTAEKEALLEENYKLQVQIAKDQYSKDQFWRTQVKMYEAKFEEFNRDVKKVTDSLKDFRPETRSMKKKAMKLEKETALWKQRWEKTQATVNHMMEIKDQRDAEMATLNNKLTTLQELCKAFQRERTVLLAELRQKNKGVTVNRKAQAEENRKSMQQVEIITKDCEEIKDNLSKLQGSLSVTVREMITDTQQFLSPECEKDETKVMKKTKNDGRNRRNTVNEKMDADKVQGSRNEGTTIVSLEKDSETSDIFDDNDIDITAAEIEILERHETVLKDIEKVLAKQAILKAEMANVQQLEKSMQDSNAAAFQFLPPNIEIRNVSDKSLKDTEELVVAISNNQNEALESKDFPRISETPLDDDNATRDAETMEKTVEADDNVCITDFEIVNHESLLETSKCDNEPITVKNTIEIEETKPIGSSKSVEITEINISKCDETVNIQEAQLIESETPENHELKTVGCIEPTETVEINLKKSVDLVNVVGSNLDEPAQPVKTEDTKTIECIEPTKSVE